MRISDKRFREGFQKAIWAVRRFGEAVVALPVNEPPEDELPPRPPPPPPPKKKSVEV